MGEKIKFKYNDVDVEDSYSVISSPKKFISTFLIVSISLLVLFYLIKFLLLYSLNFVSQETKYSLFVKVDSLYLASLAIDYKLSKQFNDLLIEKLEDKYKKIYKVNVADLPYSNAFALPGGDIVLSKKLISDLNQDTSLILFVLLHEVGHIKHNDYLKNLVNSSALNIILILLGIEDAESFLKGYSKSLLLHFSRKQENEADLFAAKQIKKIYNSIDPAVRCLQRLGEISKVNNLKFDFFLDHPSVQKRIKYIREHIND